MLYIYGIKLGLKLLYRGKFKWATRYLIIPVNYWRCLEYRLISRAGNFENCDKILDIGSPKLLSLYLAKKLGAEIYATDIDDYFIREYGYLRKVEKIPAEKFHLNTEDGRQLSFATATFNKVYSISAIEHIPDDGDTKCLREIRRVLLPGGRCVITVPFSPISQEEYSNPCFYWSRWSSTTPDGMVFYQRRYSEQDLFNRLVIPSEMKIKELKYIGENILTHSKKEVWNVLPPITGPLHPLLSKLFYTTPVDSWRDLKKPLCALLVLEKKNHVITKRDIKST